MINLVLTNEEAYLLGAIFRASTIQRKQVGDMIVKTFGDSFDWLNVNLGAKVKDAESSANLCIKRAA
jgi:hypothetical protein